MSNISAEDAAKFLDELLRTGYFEAPATAEDNVLDNIGIIVKALPPDGNFTRLLPAFEKSNIYKRLRPRKLSLDWMLKNICVPVIKSNRNRSV